MFLKTQQGLLYILDYLSWFTQSLFALTVFVTFVNVLMRYVFKHPLYWADELATIALVGMVYLSVARIEHGDDHLRLSIIDQVASNKIKLILSYFKIAVSLFLSGYLVYMSFIVTYNNYLRSSITVALKMPTFIIYSLILIAFTLIFVINIFRLISEFKKGAIK